MIKLCNPMINLGPRCSVLYFFVHGCQNLSSGSTNFHRVTNFAGNNLKHRNTLVPSGAVAWSFICHIVFSNIFPSSSSNRFVCAIIDHIYYNSVSFFRGLQETRDINLSVHLALLPSFKTTVYEFDRLILLY